MNILPIGIGPNDPNLIQGLGGEGGGYGLCEQPYACEAVGSVSLTQGTGAVHKGGMVVRWRRSIPASPLVFVGGRVGAQQGYAVDAQGLVVRKKFSRSGRGSVQVQSDEEFALQLMMSRDPIMIALAGALLDDVERAANQNGRGAECRSR